MAVEFLLPSFLGMLLKAKRLVELLRFVVTPKYQSVSLTSLGMEGKLKKKKPSI